MVSCLLKFRSIIVPSVHTEIFRGPAISCCEHGGCLWEELWLKTLGLVERRCFAFIALHDSTIFLVLFLLLVLKVLNLITIIVSKMTSHCVGTVQMREE